MKQTRIFFNWTNTLGADTTPITVSAFAPLSNSFARMLAVSSEYYPSHQHHHPSIQILANKHTQNCDSFQFSAKASILKVFPGPEEASSSATALRSSNCFCRASRSAKNSLSASRAEVERVLGTLEKAFGCCAGDLRYLIVTFAVHFGWGCHVGIFEVVRILPKSQRHFEHHHIWRTIFFVQLKLEGVSQ